MRNFLRTQHARLPARHNRLHMSQLRGTQAPPPALPPPNWLPLGPFQFNEQPCQWMPPDTGKEAAENCNFPNIHSAVLTAQWQFQLANPQLKQCVVHTSASSLPAEGREQKARNWARLTFQRHAHGALYRGLRSLLWGWSACRFY